MMAPQVQQGIKDVVSLFVVMVDLPDRDGPRIEETMRSVLGV